MNFQKHFCRLITYHELDNYQITEFHDVVQSIVSTKMVVSYDQDGDSVESVVLVYTSDHDDDMFVYEVVLDESIETDEAEDIMSELDIVFDFDFEFETNVEM